MRPLAVESIRKGKHSPVLLLDFVLTLGTPSLSLSDYHCLEVSSVNNNVHLLFCIYCAR